MYKILEGQNALGRAVGVDLQGIGWGMLKLPKRHGIQEVDLGRSRGSRDVSRGMNHEPSPEALGMNHS